MLARAPILTPSALLMRRRRSLVAQAWSPLSLFAAGEQGGWYDPTDVDRYMDVSSSPELVTNGRFDSDLTGWSADGAGASIVSGQLQIVASGANVSRFQDVPVQAGKTYMVSIGTMVGSLSRLFFYDGANFSISLTGSPLSSAGRVLVTPTGSVIRVRPWVSNGNTGTFDDISVREVPNISSATMFQDSAGTTPVTAVEQPVGRLLDKSGRGNHLIQPTSASRPTYSKRYNLLLATATLATQSVTVAAGSYTLTFAGAGSITLSGTGSGTYNAGTHTITTTAGSLTLTVSGAVTTADLRRTIHAQMGMPAYQRVTTATDYDETGFLPRLRFDGADDSMYTAASVDFSASDEMTVLAGLTKLSDAATAVVAELTASVTGNSGAFALFAPSAATPRVGYFSRGSATASADVNAAPYAAPYHAVATGFSDISADVCTLRLNGAQVATSANDQGTGNYSNAVLYVGRRNNASLPFNGDIFQLIIRGALTSGATLTSAEQYVAARTGVTL